MIASSCVRKPVSTKPSPSSRNDDKPALGVAVKSFFSRLFRRSELPTTATKQDSVSPFSCIRCTKTDFHDTTVPAAYLPDSNTPFLNNPWDPIGTVKQPCALQASFVPECLLKQIPQDAWPYQFEREKQIPFSQSFGRLLQCPFCLHIAAESDYQTADLPRNMRFVTSHSVQTFCEMDEPHPIISQHTTFINPLYGSTMTDSGISIESDKTSAARLLSVTSTARTPPTSPPKTPKCFHFSSDPPPSPAPQPVSLLSPMTNSDLSRVNPRGCFDGLRQNPHVDDRWPDKAVFHSNNSSPNVYNVYPVDARHQYREKNEDYVYSGDCGDDSEDGSAEIAPNKAESDDFMYNTNGQIEISVTPRFSVENIFSSSNIQDAVEAEKRTQLIQSRTRAQIESLLQFSLCSKVDSAYTNVTMNRCCKDARVGFYNELAILEDAKNVINRQIEEVKRQYAQMMRGKLSLPVVDRTNSYNYEFEACLPNPEASASKHFARERSYSLDDTRLSEWVAFQ